MKRQNVESLELQLKQRPDCITVRQIKNLRKMNVTRVQLGVQHFDDDVLRFIKRDCYLKDTIESNYILKQNGYKIDMHLMPDLPGSTLEKDLKMYKELFSHKKEYITNNYIKYTLDKPELQADQLKIYPCSTVPYTEIKKWYDEGSYIPYSEDKDKLIEVILYIKKNVFPWIRLNRIIRDIPQNWIDGGNKDVNLRQHLISHMKKEGLHCIGKWIDLDKEEKCIRNADSSDPHEFPDRHTSNIWENPCDLYSRQYIIYNPEFVGEPCRDENNNVLENGQIEYATCNIDDDIRCGSNDESSGHCDSSDSSVCRCYNGYSGDNCQNTNQIL